MAQHYLNQKSPAIAGRRLMTTRDYKRVMANPSEMKLWRDEQRRVGPQPVRINGRRYWFEDEVQNYLANLAASRQDVGKAVAEDDRAERTASQNN